MEILDFILVIILLGLVGFFAAVETAMFSLSKSKILSLISEKKRGASTLLAVKSNPHRLLITILIGSCLTSIFTASFVTEIAIKVFDNNGVGIATGVVTLLILVFSEIIPKSFAIQNAERLSLITAKPMQILEFILSPVVICLEGITKIVNKLTGDKKVTFTEAEIRSVISLGKEEGLLDKEATERLHSVLDFENITVKQIMTPKAQVITFDAGLTVDQFLDIVVDSPFDRYPLYEENQDKIIGVLDVIDVLRVIKAEKPQTHLKEIMRPTFFVHESTRIDTIVTQSKFKGSSLGIVINDAGKMEGVFTSQDIVEEIVGDIFENEVYKSRF